MVYALPGNVGNFNSELTNLLIKNGAKLCTCADDIIRDFEQSSGGILNPFKLGSLEKTDPINCLKKYSVSAIVANDPIFKQSRKKSSIKPSYEEDVQENIEKHAKKEASLDGFDAETVKVYKRIPLGAECNIESLADSEIPLRKVMKSLLTLEMGRFVVMLPGEKVKRNF